MDQIINFERKEEDDFYHILGCNENSTEEQIAAEYKARVLECHPDKHPDDPSAHEAFSRLSKAKDVLLDSEKRKDYDKWRMSGISIPYDRWKSMSHVKTSMHWGFRKEQPALPSQTHGQPTPAAQSQAPAAKCPPASSSMPPMNFVPRERPKVQGWVSDNSNPLLQKFRNYEI